MIQLAGKALRLAGELAIDLLSGWVKERREKRNPGLPFKDVEIQAKASRNAGHEPPRPTRKP